MLLDFFFPKKCLSCGSEGQYLCPSCLTKLKTPKQVCLECGRFSVNGITHPECKTLFSLDGLSSVWPYRGVIRKAIITLKYKFAYDVADEISFQASKILQNRPPVSTFRKVLLVPIPLSRSRENWRGFNQSAYLGREIAKNLGWQFIPDFLLRKRFVKPQTGLTRKDRLKNIFGSFSFNSKYKKISRAYQILVIDDVFTTGATMREVGRVLKKQGFKKVWGLTIAK